MKKVLILLIIFLSINNKSKAQSGFEYKIIYEYQRNYIGNKWLNWKYNNIDNKEIHKVFIDSDSITFTTPKGYLSYKVIEKNGETVSNSSFFYESYSCVDKDGLKCEIDITIKHKIGREIILILSYEYVEMRFSLEIL